MTPKQKREHKIGNQLRKLNLLKHGGKTTLAYEGVIQDGKHTERARELWNQMWLRRRAA